MRKLFFSIVLFFSTSVYAYTSEDIINFIKLSDKTIIKLAKYDSKQNVYILNENDDENHFIVVENIKNTFELNKLKNIKKISLRSNIDLKLIRRYDKDKIVTTSIPATFISDTSKIPPSKSKLGKPTPIGRFENGEWIEGGTYYKEETSSYQLFFDNNEFINLHFSFRDWEDSFFNFIYCSESDALIKHGTIKCDEIDTNDITAKPMKPLDFINYKIISIYDVENKKYFDLNIDIEKEVVVIGKKDPKEIIKLPMKKEPKSDTPQVIGTGTGFYVNDNGYIITNNHVVNKCDQILLNGNAIEVISVNETIDLALLKSDQNKTPYLYLRQSKIKQGEDIVVIGYPFGKEISSEAKITKGIISSLIGIGNDETKIQIDAAIQPGNSGGPTIGMDGKVVGVTVASANIMLFLETAGTIPQNMNFSVKPKYVLEIMKANGIEIPISMENITMNTAEIYEYANPSTVYIECWSNN